MATRKKGEDNGDGKRRKATARKAQRRPAGHGSYYRDGKGWRVVIEINDRIIRERAATEQAAKERLAELQELKRQGINVGSAAQPVESWMGVWYDLQVQTGAFKPRTLMHYRSMIERYIAPMLGDHRLDALTPELIQKFVFAVRDEIKERHAATRPSYDGVKTARDCAMVLDMALRLAVDRKILAENPYRGIRLPKPPARRPQQVTIEQLVRQLRRFLWAADDHPLTTLWYTYALLGLRAGEGLGITWRGLDLERGVLHVFQQVQTIPRTAVAPMHLTIGSPKSGAGERYLPLPRVLVELYRAERERWLKAAAAAGESWQGGQYDLVFCNRTGGPLWPRNVEEEYQRVREWAGLPRQFTQHQFRRVVASLLNTLHGITEAVKAEILGHKKTEMSVYYTTGVDEAKRAVLESLAQLVLGERSSEAD